MNKKYLKSLLSFILTIGLTVPAVALGNSTAVFGAESGSDSEESVTIVSVGLNQPLRVGLI